MGGERGGEAWVGRGEGGEAGVGRGEPLACMHTATGALTPSHLPRHTMPNQHSARMHNPTHQSR